MASSSQKLAAVLPTHVLNTITTSENNEQYILDLLQKTLPKSDTSDIANELKKSFILSKIKNRRKENKQKKAKSLSSRKRIRFGLDRINLKNSLSYSELLPLHELWLGYIEQTLGSKTLNNMPENVDSPRFETVNEYLMKADFHGARISIEKSRCPSLVGKSGIVILDTKFSFNICGEDNIVRVIPKEVVMIKIYLRDTTLIVLGKQLCTKPVERTKKLKAPLPFVL